MPLTLQPPIPGRTSRYTIRGTHLGVRVHVTAGTPDRKVAQRELKRIEREIEEGRFVAAVRGPTFASAMQAYLDAGHSDRFLLPLLDHFQDKPLSEIDQIAIDTAAAKLYPKGTPATRNRQVHTPVSAILKHAKVPIALSRPKGHAGREKTDWLTPEEAARAFDAATAVDPEFAVLLHVYVYTGCRLSEGLRMKWSDVDLDGAVVTFPKTKNGKPRSAPLPPHVVDAMLSLPRARATVFRYQKNGHLYNTMHTVREACGVEHLGFHVCRHTYATWMRKYGGLDTRGLVGTGAWKSEKSAARYAHVVVSEESLKVMNLPGVAAPKKGSRRRVV